MDGECALQQHSAFLVCHPSLCRLLAQDAPLTISAFAANLGSDHFCARMGYVAMAFRASLFFRVDVGAGSASDVFWFEDIRPYPLWLWNTQAQR